ncbi:Protein-like OF MAMMALIAN LYST-INTERACTING PROTEIN 5 [Quillaja saponaria]|uniref:Protein-like OF MAMMALIAN LYST-INTERACTING PROTEIN 5 n=1 Tax=Quillaja saponaria TaxID=32244 RepID=A0AAD7PQ38_QUISA|nr:Protein-like OF MAMMALIAN LYST-INTERACTING PROTEIN 5 [Quillaja saponaria]
MAGDNEPAKLLLPYLQRADELQKHEPLVAYYCRLYAMERGLKIPQSERTKTTSSLLVSLIKQLEKDKKSLKLVPEDSLYLEGFALNVFSKADKQDRAGRADLNTAKTFYAASIFFEILNQFGVLHPDLEQKQKYAVWKAADIRKALKEGRRPQPGPPAGDEDLSVPSSTPSTRGYDLGPSETNTFSSQGPESDPSNHFQNTVKYEPSPRIPPAPKFHNSVDSHYAPDFPPTSKFQDTVDNQHATDFPPAPKFHATVSNQHTADFPPAPKFHDTVDNQYSTDIPPSPQFHGKANIEHTSNTMPSSPPYPSADYPSHNFHPPPPASRSEFPYSQTYNHQLYPQDQQQHFTPNYTSYETPSVSYPHFQSYPSFTESSLPAVSSNYVSYYQGSDASYSAPPAPPLKNSLSSAQYNSSSGNGTVSEPVTSVQTYQYDSNYVPPPEKIAEAQKAARFAVGALAFDDVSVAVDHLRRSLAFLTNPSAGQ